AKGKKKKARAPRKAAKKTAAKKAAARSRKPVKKPSPKKPAPAVPAPRAPLLRKSLLRRHARPAPGPRVRDPFDIDLARNAANFQPLTPLNALERAANVFPEHIAIIHGRQRFTYAQFYARCRCLASALAARGIRKGDTAAVM